MSQERRAGDHAVVVGASMAGLAAASVLARRFSEVTIVERDVLPASPATRRGVPQARHAHALLAAGRDVLDRLHPGLLEELHEHGAHRVDFAHNAIWYQEGGRRVRYRSAVEAVGLSRALLEDRLRARVVALPNVALVDGAPVRRLRFDAAGDAVTGVVVERDGAELELAADLVVDASGRSAPLLGHLVAAGFPAPAESQVRVDMAYASHVLDSRTDDLGGADYLVAMAATGRTAFVLPLEGDRWILTLSGPHGDRPPTDRDGLVAFARSIPVPELADLVDRVGDEPAVTHRLPSSQRRHAERLRRVPAGYLLLGDALCSFNPVYGQGMTSALLQAEALGAVIDRVGVDSTRLPRRFYRAAARVIANPWRIAVGTDFNHPRTTGPRPLGTRLVNRYMARVFRACHSSTAIAEQMARVQNLLAAPTSLMRPDRVVRALWASRRPPESAPTSVPARRPVATP